MKCNGIMSNIETVVFLAFAVQVTSFRIKDAQYTYSVENSLTCYTCPDKGNNEDCNSWAPDKFCPPGHTVCETVHRFHHHSGKSVFVEKRCAPPTECTAESIGCKKLHKKHHKHQIECRSCCRDSYCNRGVPYNMTTSLQLSLSMFKVTPNTAAVSHDKIWPITVLLTAIITVIT